MSVIPPDMLRRAERCVCKFCGGTIEPAVIVYNRYGGSGLELYCSHCGKGEKGIEKELYLWAKEFVHDSGFNYFTEQTPSEERTQHNIAKVCTILSWHLRRTGHLTDKGLDSHLQKQLLKRGELR
jgi:hypothetical protein